MIQNKEHIKVVFSSIPSVTIEAFRKMVYHDRSAVHLEVDEKNILPLQKIDISEGHPNRVTLVFGTPYHKSYDE